MDWWYQDKYAGTLADGKQYLPIAGTRYSSGLAHLSKIENCRNVNGGRMWIPCLNCVQELARVGGQCKAVGFTLPAPDRASASAGVKSTAAMLASL